MIVIPMAGLSQRFTSAGYVVPKYMLEAHGHSLFWHSVSSFADYFDREPFCFIYRNVADTGPFIRSEIEQMGIRDYQCIALDAPTGGQAETVALGLETAKIEPEAPLTIFNIDTFRPGFRYPSASFMSACDGYLEVFQGLGEHWSFALPAEVGSTLVAATAEKRRVSDLCSTGLYYFRTATLFREAYDAERRAPQGKELYIAPIYNHLIKSGRAIHYFLIDKDDVIFCGVPDEYQDFLRQAAPHTR